MSTVPDLAQRLQRAYHKISIATNNAPRDEEASKCPKLNEFPAYNLYDELITIRIDQNPAKTLSSTKVYHATMYPDEDSEAWSALASWLYTRRLKSTASTPPPNRPSRPVRFPNPPEDTAKPPGKDKLPEHCINDYDLLCRIYVLGDMRFIPALKNAVIDTSIDTWALDRGGFIPSAKAVRWAFENTSAGSGLRRLLVDLHTRCLNVCNEVWEAMKDEELRSYHVDFLRDVMVKFARLRTPRPAVGDDCVKDGDWLRVDKCVYHDHTDIHDPRIKDVPHISQEEMARFVASSSTDAASASKGVGSTPSPAPSASSVATQYGVWEEDVGVGRVVEKAESESEDDGEKSPTYNPCHPYTSVAMWRLFERDATESDVEVQVENAWDRESDSSSDSSSDDSFSATLVEHSDDEEDSEPGDDQDEYNDSEHAMLEEVSEEE
ncbi:hypothetical protein EJ08DRAFT_736176 [Tothia fuscella]|uniref:Uncharacterized protein n=1 Tax=Tothia fuscella TaxID=1048955 RepID=A0A9P4NMJ4_9PEZI|nr:hypothetical protein EJ08DRAFT_736176 [Tothia fuscella]